MSASLVTSSGRESCARLVSFVFDELTGFCIRYVGLNILCGAVWSPFLHLAANLIQTRYSLTESDAANAASYLLAWSVLLYPIVSSVQSVCLCSTTVAEQLSYVGWAYRGQIQKGADCHHFNGHFCQSDATSIRVACSSSGGDPYSHTVDSSVWIWTGLCSL